MNRFLPRAALLLACAALAGAAQATPVNVTDTDSARREAGRRIAAAQPRPPAETVAVTDTDSARRAAGLAWMRARHRAVEPVVATDTDSARRAAGQAAR